MGSVASVRCQIVPCLACTRFIGALQMHSLSVISTLEQGGEGGHLFRLTVQLCWGEGGNLQTNITGMLGSVCSAWTMLGLPQPKAACTPPGPHHSGSRVLCKGTAPSGPCILCTSQV